MKDKIKKFNEFNPINEFLDNDKLTKFNILAEQVENKWGMMSGRHDIMSDPNYQEIVHMGKNIIPLLLKKLEKSGMWLEALSSITGGINIPESHRGKINLIKQDWKNWAKKSGYE